MAGSKRFGPCHSLAPCVLRHVLLAKKCPVRRNVPHVVSRVHPRFLFVVRWIRVCPVTSLRPLYHGTVATDIAVLPPELEFFLLLYHYQDAPLPNCQAEHRNHQTTIVTRLFMLVCHRSSLTHDSAVIPRSTEAGDAPSSEANPVIRHRASSSSSSPIHTRPCFLVFSLPALPPLALPLPQDVASDSPV
jgi:hypothetical protein